MNLNEQLRRERLFVIVRGIYGDTLDALAQALRKGGIRLMEVTFDQSDPNCREKTAGAIAMLCRSFPEMCFGAGTVLTPEQVETAHRAGANFIVSPNTDPAVIGRTLELGMTSIPGAMTPTEILQARRYGADFVKLFPAAALGLRYAKDLMAPLGHVPLVAAAGVTEENYGEFLKLGFTGAGVSGRLTDKACIAAGAWEELTARAAAFTAIARMAGPAACRG